MGQAYDENMDPLGGPEFGESEKEVREKLRRVYGQKMLHALIGKMEERQAREQEIAESEADAVDEDDRLSELQKILTDAAQGEQ